MRLHLALLVLVTCFQTGWVGATESVSEKTAERVQSIDINTADASRLAEVLPGIGPAKAALIVKWRTENGPFIRIDQLQQIKGIGPKTLEKLRAFARIGLGTSSSKRWPEKQSSEQHAQLAIRRIFTAVRNASDPANIDKLPVKPWYRKSAFEILSIR